MTINRNLVRLIIMFGLTGLDGGALPGQAPHHFGLLRVPRSLGDKTHRVLFGHYLHYFSSPDIVDSSMVCGVYR